MGRRRPRLPLEPRLRPGTPSLCPRPASGGGCGDGRAGPAALIETSGRSAAERNRLGQDPIPKVWRKALLGDHIDSDAEGRLEIGAESHQVEKASTLRHVDKQIQIARVGGVAARLATARAT